MECLHVRPLLAELVLDALSPADDRAVRRHLEWCAGCRKEARELAEGAAVAAGAIPLVEPPGDLEDRVVEAVRRARMRRDAPPGAGSARPRRSRGAILAVALTGLLALGAVGWAVAMTDRANRMEEAAETAEARASSYEAVLTEMLRDVQEGSILSAELAPVAEAAGGGRAVIFDSPGGYDWALVIAGGLDPGDGPYRALLVGGGQRGVGRLRPSAQGELAAYRIFNGDISAARTVVVRNAMGTNVLRGAVEAPEPEAADV